MRWRYGILIGIFLALLSLYPQAALIAVRGPEYNGATFVNDNDEPVYIAYLQSLIDGRPRRNNIYLGGTEEPPETFLSIQALPAYAAAFPARSAGLTAERTFLILSVISAFFSALALFWFLSKVTGNDSFAAAATLAILILGASVSGYGVLKFFLGINPASASLPFLRRYTPGLVFPFFLLLFAIVWRAYSSQLQQKRNVYVLGTAFFFGVLIYSYFYLWTAAIAWMLILALLTLALKANAREIFTRFWLPVFVICVTISIPYAYLILQRSSSTDGSQALEATRQLVLTKPSIWLGSLIILATFLLARYKHAPLNRPITLFVISFALLPLVLFDQQIISGYSLQPFHYNLYIAPYSALISLVLFTWEAIGEQLSKLKPYAWLPLIALIGAWGIIESHYVTGYRMVANIRRDETIPLNRRLAELGHANFGSAASQVTFNSDDIQADNQPAIAPYGVLWSEHLPWASSVSSAAARRRYFLHMYFSDRDAAYLSKSLENCNGGTDCKSLFGWRAIPTLAIGDHQPTPEERAGAVLEFEAFLRDVSAKDAYDPVMSYAVVPQAGGPDLSRIDRWYRRDGGEVHGKFRLYKLEPLDMAP